MSEYIFKTSDEIKKYINSKLRKVQEEFAQRLLDLLKEFEYEDVYSKPAINYVGYSAEDDRAQKDRGFWMYDRTEDLYDLFQATFKGSNQYKSMFSIIPMNSKLSHSWEDFQHSSPYGDDLTAEEYLTIIEKGIPDSNKTMFGNEISPRPFWEDFLDYVEKYEMPRYRYLLNKEISVTKPLSNAAEVN